MRIKQHDRCENVMTFVYIFEDETLFFVCLDGEGGMEVFGVIILSVTSSFHLFTDF